MSLSKVGGEIRVSHTIKNTKREHVASQHKAFHDDIISSKATFKNVSLFSNYNSIKRNDDLGQF